MMNLFNQMLSDYNVLIGLFVLLFALLFRLSPVMKKISIVLGMLVLYYFFIYLLNRYFLFDNEIYNFYFEFMYHVNNLLSLINASLNINLNLMLVARIDLSTILMIEYFVSNYLYYSELFGLDFVELVKLPIIELRININNFINNLKIIVDNKIHTKKLSIFSFQLRL